MKLAVNINGVIQVAGELGRYENILNTYRNAVLNVKNNCPGSGVARSMMVRTLNDIMTEINNEKSLLNVMGQKLEECANAYRTFEENIAKCDGSTSVIWNQNTTEEGAEEEKTSYWTWKDTWKVIGTGGIIGSGIAAVGNLATGGFNLKNILNSGKFVTSIVGGAASVAKAGTKGEWWKYLYGGQKVLEKSVGSFVGDFNASIQKQLKDLSWTKASTTADKVKVGAKWAGHLLSFAINGMDNYSEFEGQGAYGFARGTAETVIETGVDIGMGMAITAGLSAAFVGAPAVAVGAGAVLVTWGANAICKWATGGKDIGEVVADVYCDYVEDKVEAIKEGVQKVGEGIKEGVQKVGEGIKNVGESVKNGLSSAWSGICSVFG